MSFDILIGSIEISNGVLYLNDSHIEPIKNGRWFVEVLDSNDTIYSVTLKYVGAHRNNEIVYLHNVESKDGKLIISDTQKPIKHEGKYLISENVAVIQCGCGWHLVFVSHDEDGKIIEMYIEFKEYSTANSI